MPYWRDTWISLTSACAAGRIASDNAAATNVRADLVLARTRVLAVISPPPSCFCEASGALVEARQNEFAVAERLGRGEAPVRRAEHHVEQLVARLVPRHFALQQPAR